LAANVELTAELIGPARLRALVTARYMILIPVVVLTLLGLVMTMSAHTVLALNDGDSPYTAGWKQAAYALAGAVAGWLLAWIPRLRGRVVAWAALATAFAAQIAMLFTPWGVDKFGNRAWLKVPLTPLTIQPSEFIKLGLALWLGLVLALKWRELRHWSGLAAPALIGIVISVGLVAAGKDMGTALIIGLIGIGALVLAGVPWTKMACVVAVAGLAGAVAVKISPERFLRMMVAYNPSACEEAPEACWQIKQAGFSMARGSWFGSGLGASRAKWAYLSQADSDFIYAIIGEELGVLGGLAVLVLFAVLGWGLFQVVRLHPSRRVQITTGAVACWIEVQALVNIGMVIGLMPVIGVPLPFVSSGGSALVSGLMAIGAVFGLMRTNQQVDDALRWRSRRSRRVAAVVRAGGGTPTR
jgi:cell division protein FtsW